MRGRREKTGGERQEKITGQGIGNGERDDGEKNFFFFLCKKGKNFSGVAAAGSGATAGVVVGGGGGAAGAACWHINEPLAWQKIFN